MPNIESLKKLFNLKRDPKLILNWSTTSEKTKATFLLAKKKKKGKKHLIFKSWFLKKQLEF